MHKNTPGPDSGASPLTIRRELDQISRFSPNLLIRQLLEEAVLHQKNHQEVLPCQPSLRKFHGAVLFVDISGFTQLSQKLDVDNLRKFINAYFKKLIDIVHKYSGEIIKFAGDAMYIVWQTPAPPTDIDERILKLMLENACSCAQEIIRVCSNYKVDLRQSVRGDQKPQIYGTRLQVKQMASFIPSLYLSGRHGSDNGRAPDAQFAYLNVHCGLSFGWMAGIDVGYDHRWEYFIVGEPLTDVAAAESCASKGEIGLSDAVHCIIHDDGLCMCARQDDACWILQSPSNSAKLSSKLGPASLTIDTVAQSHDVHVLQHVGELQDSICRAVQVHSDSQNQSTTDASEFSRFQQVLYEHLMLHTHEVIRNMMSTKSTVLPTSRQTSPRVQSSLPSPSVSSMRRGELDGRRTPVFVRRLRQMTTVDQHPAASETRNIDVADQRDVVTVFVSIEWDGNMAVAPVDVSTCGLTPYHFVVETDRDKLDHDQRVLQAYQTCFRIVIQCFHKAGGQIRQFIVDDKGTVAICTFGLRGSVSKEAATDAVEASLRLIEMLNLELNASASVGITSGKAYNGLVGSSERHEFAVMGPSVNMSARLMGKAPKNGVLCDETVRHSDKFHQFVHFADVIAKGYDAPVATFAPVTTDRSASMYLSKIATQVESNHQNKLDDDGSTDDLVFIGRKQELANICVFLQQMSGNDEAWWHILLGGRGIDRRLRPPTMVHRETNENNHENESNIPVYSFAHCLDSIQSRLLVVEGSHGIGKTHLLQSISQRIAKYLDQTGFAATLAIHCIPQIKLKQSEPFSSMKPLLDTLLNRYMDWTAKRSFDPLAVTELSRRSRMKTLRSLAMLVDKMPFEVQVLQPLLGLINKSYAADDNDTTRALSPPDRLQQLGHFLFVLLQTFQQAIGRVLFLNIDELYVMDRSTQGLLKQLLEKGKGFVVMTAASFETVESDEYLAIHALKAAVSEPQRVCTVQLDAFTMREIQSFVRVMGHKMVTTLVPLFASSSSVSSGGSSGESPGDDDTVVERTMALVQQVDIQQISDLTGGVPLYLRELVQEIVHQALRPANQGNVTGSSSIDNSSGRVLMSSHTWFKRVKRVEEVIAMRFDQLDRKMQLLMKVVAVACAFGADASPVMVTRMMMEYVTDACAVFNCAKNSERSLLTKIGELMETLSSSNTFLMKTSRVSNNNSESIDYDPGAGTGTAVGGGGGDTTTGMAASPPHMHASLSSPTSSGKKNARAVLLPENTSYFDLMRLATRSASTLNSSPSTVRQPSTVSSAAAANHVVNHSGPMSPTTPGSTWGTTEDSALQDARYNFRIDLEQEVIYGMLLQEQKVLLHLHAAVHYQQCEEAQQVLPMSCTHDQALHWEAAQEYQRALSCFFRAATTLLHSGAVPEAMHYLELAYQMFYAMKQTATKELFASNAGAPSQEISTGANTRGPAAAAAAATVTMTAGMPTGASPGIAIDRRFSVSFDDHSWPATHTPATMPVVTVDDEDSAYEAMIQYYSMENVQRLLMAFAGQCKVNVPVHCPTIDPSSLLWNRAKCADLFGNDRVLLEECIASISYLVCLKAQRDVDPETLWYLCAEALELLFVNARSTSSLPASPRWELSSSSSSSKSFASRMMGLSDRRELSGSAARTPEGLTLLSLPSQGASRMDVAAETIREPLDPELPSSSTFGIDRSDALCLHVIYYVMQTVARLAAAAALQAATSSLRASHPPLTAALPLSPAAVRDMQTVSAQLMVSMARTLALTRPELCFHVPVALSHQLTLLLPEMALSDTAVPLLAEILATYDYASMHVAIGDFYGEDLVLSTLVDCWKLAYVSGDMFHLEKLWNCLINIDLENTLHTASMIWTGWNVALALVLMQRVEEAYLCFSKLLLVIDQHPDFHGIYDDTCPAGNGAGGSGGGGGSDSRNGRNSDIGSGSGVGGSNGRGGSGSACHRNLVEYYAIVCAMQVRNKFVTGAYQTSDTHLSPLLFELPSDFDITNIERTVHFLASRVGLWDKLQAGDFSAVCWSTPPSPTAMAAADGTSPATNSPGVGSPELTPTGPDATATTTAATVPRPSLAHVAWTMRMERMGCSAEALFAWACTLQAEYLLVKLTQDTDTLAAPAIREQAVQIGLHLSLAATYLHAAETAIRISNGVETLLDCSQLNGERLFLQQVAQDRAALLQRLQRLLPVGLGMGVPMNGESPNGGGSHGSGGLAVDVDMHWPLSPLVAPSPTFTHHPAAPTSTPLPTPTSSTFGPSMRPTVATSATPSSTGGGGTAPFRALGAQLARLRLLQAAQVALDPPPSPGGPSIPLGRSRPDWTTAQIPVVIRAMQVHYATMAKRTATPRREADAVLFAKFPLLLQKYYAISSSSLDHSHSHSGLVTVNM